jgi:hypothetical protein
MEVDEGVHVRGSVAAELGFNSLALASGGGNLVEELVLDDLKLASFPPAGEAGLGDVETEVAEAFLGVLEGEVLGAEPVFEAFEVRVELGFGLFHAVRE